MLSANHPIGIFDSGIGGLTVANAIYKLLPKENIVYFGDTAHLPYGDKSPHAIAHYTQKITEFLIQHKAKIIVIACNTASSYGFDAVNNLFGHRVKIINVIDPMVDYVTQNKLKNIGVIGTKGTINSKIYQQKINEQKPSIQVIEKATPLLAPLVEESFYNTPISKLVLSEYLNQPNLKNIEGLVLACTHYPLLKNDILEVLGNEVTIFDSSEIIAQQLKTVLTKLNLLGNTPHPQHKFYLSDYTETFEKNAQMFFGTQIHLEERNIWK